MTSLRRLATMAARAGATVLALTVFVWAVDIAGPRVHASSTTGAVPAGQRSKAPPVSSGVMELAIEASGGFRVLPRAGSGPDGDSELQWVPAGELSHLPSVLQRPGSVLLGTYSVGTARIYFCENPGDVLDNLLFYRARAAFDGWTPHRAPQVEGAAQMFLKPGRTCFVKLDPAPDRPGVTRAFLALEEI